MRRLLTLFLACTLPLAAECRLRIDLKAELTPFDTGIIEKSATWDFGRQSTLDEFAFLYSYDSAGRLVSAKTPGCAPAHTRYSRAGRVIATRTPAMAAGQWIMHFYDRYGREVLSAIMPATEGELKTIAQNLPVARHTGRDALTAGYTFSPALPFAKTTHTEPLVAVYFDNYDFISDIGDDGAFLLATGHLAAPKGLATGRRDFVAGTAEAFYYDTDGFVAERRQLLHAGIRTIAYRRDDQGNPLREDEVFTHTSGKQWKRVTERTYDNAGRPVLVSVTENGVTATTTLSYSPQGHVASEKHSNGVSRLFSHDTHGWLTHTETRVPLRPQIRDSIRLPMLAPGYYGKLPGVRDSLVADVVKPDIRPPIAITESYHDRIFYAEGNAPRFTGCPAARQTSLGGRYDYRFDAHDRLTHAMYTAPTDADTYEDFSVRYTYDNLARPTSVQRHGIVEVDADGGETFGMLDNLKFRYDGSRLNSISNESDGENYYGRSGYPAVSGSYEWNSAGCLTKDTARRITEISYNHINRPTHTEIGDGNYFYNYYDAEGMLIRTGQTRKRLTAKLVRTYCADRVFIGNNLEYSYFPGGYFDADGAVHFIHSDHQGSVVMVTDSAGQIEQHNSYYPYGEPHRAPEGQPMLYAGKERLAPTAEYDYGARRHFPPALLWYTPDAHAKATPEVSPYVFCNANPIAYVDPDGNFSKKWMAKISRFWNNLTNKGNVSPVIENPNAKDGAERFYYERRYAEDGGIAITRHQRFSKQRAEMLQTAGTAMSVAGYAATLSVVGAEVGVGLAEAGQITTTTGMLLESGVDLLNIDWNNLSSGKGNAAKDFFFLSTNILINSALKAILPGHNVGEEILKQGVGLKLSIIESTTTLMINNNNKQEQEQNVITEVMEEDLNKQRIIKPLN